MYTYTMFTGRGRFLSYLDVTDWKHWTTAHPMNLDPSTVIFKIPEKLPQKTKTSQNKQAKRNWGSQIWHGYWYQTIKQYGNRLISSKYSSRSGLDSQKEMDYWRATMIDIFSQSVQSLNRVRLFVTPWIAACQASLSITNSRSLLKLMSIESVMAIQPSHPLSSPSPPAPNPSQHQGLFQWVNSLHKVAKVLEFQL